MPAKSNTYRLRAITSEQRAKETSDQSLKKEWDDLAIEWHLLANLSAPTNDRSFEIDIA